MGPDTITLIKLSSPGFEKTGTEEEIKKLMYKYVCSQCRAEYGVSETSDLDDMLNTFCAAEFTYEK